MDSIPIIDLASSNVVNDIRRACIDYGFFYLKGHSVTSLSSCFSCVNDFFNLSTTEKSKYTCNKYNLGYTSFQDETLSPSKQACGDTKEGYYIARESETQGEESRNVWPTSSSLSSEQWKNCMIKYHQECTRLGQQLIRLIAQSLHLDEIALDQITTGEDAILRLIKYGRILSDPSKGIYGAGEHSDYGLITLLATNDVPGLEIYVHNKWIPIPPLPDTFIVNIGDSLQIITNSIYKSTLHRVLINTSGKDRYSIAFFYEPNRSSLLTPLPSLISHNEESHDITHKSDTLISLPNKLISPPIPNHILPKSSMTYGEYLQYKYDITSHDFKKNY